MSCSVRHRFTLAPFPTKPFCSLSLSSSPQVPEMPRVFIADKLEIAGVELLAAEGIEVDNRPGLTGEALLAALRGADAVIVRSSTKITAALLENPGRLKAVVRAGVGVDTIDVPA